MDKFVITKSLCPKQANIVREQGHGRKVNGLPRPLVTDQQDSEIAQGESHTEVPKLQGLVATGGSAIHLFSLVIAETLA